MARFVSIAFHPMITLMLAVAYAAGPTLDRAHFGILIGATAASLLAIAAYVVIQLRRGAIGNIDVSRREDRPRMYAVGIASTLLCALLFWFLHLPPRVIMGALVSASLLTASVLANTQLKVSLHVAYTAFAVGLVWALLPGSGQMLGVLLVGAMVWSRVSMRRHTLPEAMAGACIGTLAAVAYNLLN